MKKFDSDIDLRNEINSLQVEQQKILLELFQDGCDVIIPASMLEYIPVSQGVVGIVGTITSIIGCRNAWPSK